MYSASAFGVGAAWHMAVLEKPAPSVAPQIPEASASVNEPPAPTQPVKKIYADKNVEAGGKKFVLRADVQEAFAQSRFPDELLINICARESTCDPTAINDKSGAMGLFQFLPKTLYETLYLHGAEHGYTEEAKLVERYKILQKVKDTKQNIRHKTKTEAQAQAKADKDKDKKKKDELPVYGYRPVSEEARKIIAALALNPLFNTKMHDAYTYKHVQVHLKQTEAKPGPHEPLTYAHMTAMNNLGPYGLSPFLDEVRKNEASGKHTLARDFFNRKENKKRYGGKMDANKTMLFDKDNKPITMVQSWDRIKKFGGDKPLVLKQPDLQPK